MGFMAHLVFFGFETRQVHVLTGGENVKAHRLAGGFRIAMLDGDEDGFVVLDGRGLADAADGAQAAGESEFTEGVEHEPVNQIAAGIGNRMVEGEIALDRGVVVGGLLQARAGSAATHEAGLLWLVPRRGQRHRARWKAGFH